MSITTLAQVEDAAARIAGAVVRTPLLRAGWGDPRVPLHLKPESLQPTGAFKLRGATNAIALLGADARAHGVVTHSSGNHAQALAWAARAAGVPAVIVMPDNAPAVKVEATRALGAEVVLVPIGERETAAEEVRRERGATMVPPYDDAAVIAGQGTVGLEIAADLPEVASVLSNPKVSIVTDDGRRWLRLHPDRKFDAIVSNTTWHFRANVTNLLSAEFLDLIGQHL